jgi:hypothetical protein
MLIWYGTNHGTVLRISRTLDSFTDEVTTLIPIATHKASVFLHFSIHKSWLWLGLSRIIRLHTRRNENDAVTHGSRNHKSASHYHAIAHHASRIDEFATNVGAWKAGHVVFFSIPPPRFLLELQRCSAGPWLGNSGRDWLQRGLRSRSERWSVTLLVSVGNMLRSISVHRADFLKIRPQPFPSTLLPDLSFTL